jgi:hypothetical protein
MKCLSVDKVKPGGSGTSKEGNIRVDRSCLFFKHYRESARISGVDENLIRRFYVILQSISSGFELSIEDSTSIQKTRAKLFVIDYP